MFLLLRLAGLVFLIELLVMFGLHATHMEDLLQLHAGATAAAVLLALLDAFALILVAAPAAYYWVVRPYVLARNKAEEALRRSEALLSRIMATVPEAIITVDENQRIRRFNRGAERLFGYAAEEAGGQNVGLLLPDRFRAAHRDHMADFASAAEPTRMTGEQREISGQRKDGTEFPAESSISRLDLGGKTLLTVVLRDITERKRVEAALRASEERFRGIFDNSPSAIMLKDLGGRFRFVNPRFEEWYGIAAADVIGKTSEDIFDAKPAEFSIAQDRRVLESDAACEYELELTFADGRLHTVVSTKFPVRGADGRTVGIGTISTDIGERRRLEEQLRQSQKMEAVGQLAGGVAHEFNNLLMIILGNADLLGAELEGNEPQRSHVEAIEQAALRGGQLAEQLLAFSRRKPLLPETLDFSEHVRAAESLLRPALGKTIDLQILPGEGLWLVKTDPGQFQEAILNLVLNSRDAMPEGGRVTIETANVRFDETRPAPKPKVRPGEYVMLAVGDTGCGMSRAAVERAFDPFFTTKEVGKGTGLGLSMVHGFAEQSGGFSWIESEEGRGASVRLYLPRALDQTEERPPAAQDGLELARLPSS
ncbi:MAG: PAS domain S-box protein [Dongiaceae bacterium]